MSERRKRLERALRGCAERGVPAETVDLWPAIRGRVSGEQTTETHVSQESVSDSGSRRCAWRLRLVPDTPLGYALAVFLVLLIAAGA